MASSVMTDRDPEERMRSVRVKANSRRCSVGFGIPGHWCVWFSDTSRVWNPGHLKSLDPPPVGSRSVLRVERSLVQSGLFTSANRKKTGFPGGRPSSAESGL